MPQYKRPAQPFTIRPGTFNGKDVYMVWCGFKYSDLAKSVKPGWWQPEVPALVQGAGNGAWCYPQAPELAARLWKTFQHIAEIEKGAYIDPEFAKAAKLVPVTMIEIEHIADQKVFKLKVDYTLKGVVKAIPGVRAAWDKKPGQPDKFLGWHLPASQSAALAAQQVFNDQCPDDWQQSTKLCPEFKAMLAEVEKEITTAATAPEIVSKLKGWDHQIEAFNRAWAFDSYMLAMQMGAGKSKVAVDLVVNKGFKITFVVTVKSAVKSVWPKQFDLYAGKPVKVLALAGKGMDGKNSATKVVLTRQFLQECQKENVPAVVVMNYHLCIQPVMADFLLKAPIDCIIADESQNLQAPGGKISKFFATWGRRVVNKYCLTGTPLKSGPLSIYGQYRFMAPEVFGTNYNQFSQQYAVLDQYGQPSRFINQTELTRKIYSRAYRVLTTDVLQLPEKTHITLDFELSDQAKKHYDELEAAMMTEIDEGLLTVSNGLVKLLRLQQITSGYLPIVCPGQPTTFNLVDKGKYDLMADLFDGITEAEPFIVFARFSKDLETIHQAAKACGLSSMELSGHKNQLEEWQNGQATVLAVQIQAGGAGIDLTRARYVCYFSLGYSLDDYEQSLFRAYRPGQTRPVTIYHLVARDTVDQIIMKALEGKANVVETILGGWKAKSKLT
jgi:hypothetical protein